MIDALAHALSMAFAMGWEILWPLILGFFLSAVVQAVVSHREMSRLLPDDRPRAIAIALALGAASSSCSYAAVALARSLFRKGANFTAAMAFEMASTNLVAELGIIMLVLLGWQLTVAEFIGAPIMVALLVVIFRLFLSPELVQEAKVQADRGIAGRMEGHAEMDMSVTEGGTLWQRITSAEGLTAISHYFVMDWAAVWLDIVGGLLIAGALAAWVPPTFWQSLFLVDHPLLATLWGPIVGPLVAVISFVCSVGNIPLAAVLWNGGISFGGVIAFIFADLIVLPILDIYRKYYGWRMAGFLLVGFYVSMVGAAMIVEGFFWIAGLIPPERNTRVVEASIEWNYTTWLNIPFLVLAALLVWRFLKTGGPEMLRMMNRPAETHSH
jgi:uncharacterized membrane protein YraQ (UPF0718 family)